MYWCYLFRLRKSRAVVKLLQSFLNSLLLKKYCLTLLRFAVCSWMKTENIWCNVMNHVSLTLGSSSWLQVCCNRTCVKIMIKNAGTQNNNKTWFYFACTYHFSHGPFFGGCSGKMMRILSFFSVIVSVYVLHGPFWFVQTHFSFEMILDAKLTFV